VIVESGEKVRVDGEDEGSAAELDSADEPLEELEGDA